MSLISFKRIVQATCCGVKRCNKNVLIICCYKLENLCSSTHTHTHSSFMSTPAGPGSSICIHSVCTPNKNNPRLQKQLSGYCAQLLLAPPSPPQIHHGPVIIWMFKGCTQCILQQFSQHLYGTQISTFKMEIMTNGIPNYLLVNAGRETRQIWL